MAITSSFNQPLRLRLVHEKHPDTKHHNNSRYDPVKEGLRDEFKHSLPTDGAKQ
jgi:hypothetical protein